MVMSCCSALNSVFDEKKAEKNLKSYYKKGLRKETKVLVDFLKGHAAGMTVLEVGCGVGYLNMELVKLGASRSLGLDISKAYISAARELRDKLGLQKNVELKLMDFVENEKNVKKADVVVNDKVICCYPNMEKFISTTASHANKFYGIIYPRNFKILRLLFRIINPVFQFIKKTKGFRFYIYNPEEMKRVVEHQGFKRSLNETKGLWEISVFEK